jgi:hypothetical protein
MSRMADDQIKSQRTILERVGVRWPSTARRMMRSVLRLPPGSRVRRAMLARAARIVCLSWNRGDFALVPYLDDPEVETRLTVGSSRVTMGLDPVYYGPEGHCRVMEDWNEAWQEWDAEVDEIIEEGAIRSCSSLGSPARERQAASKWRSGAQRGTPSAKDAFCA